MVSVNQVRHLFVVDSLVTGNNIPATEGEVKVCQGVNGVYLQYMGKGGLLTSDYIKPGQVISCKTVTATATPLKETLLELSEPLVAGADYIVDVLVSNYIAMADESTLVKFGAVHATSSMSASDFYLALAKSLARNFSRDINKFFKVYVTDGTNSEEVTVASGHTGKGYTGVVIAEQAQTADYVRGEFGVSTINYKVVPHTILVDGDEVCPFVVQNDGTVEPVDKIARGTDTVVEIGNGYEIADTEYFTMGERGDIYRQMGYPNTIRTKYMVDETQEYDVLDIAFYFVGRGIDAQKSEKILTLVEVTGGGVLAQVETALKQALNI